MLEAVLKRIKYVKERSHPAKNWMAFIIVFFCYLVFCIFGDWRVCVLCVFCVAVFLPVFSCSRHVSNVRSIFFGFIISSLFSFFISRNENLSVKDPCLSRVFPKC